MDRNKLAPAVASAIALAASSAFGAEPAADRPRSTSLVLAAGCQAPCQREPDGLDDFRTLGLRVSETQLLLGDSSSTEAGVLLALNHHEYASAGPLTSRLREVAFIGGSSADLEGGLGGDWAVGWRAPFGHEHGVFARLGLRGQLLGNGAFYASALEVPVGQAGYQLLRGRELSAEVALSAAPMLIGRYNVDGAASRRIGGSFDPGGHVSLHAYAVHLEASYARVLPGSDDGLGALDWFAAELCGTASPIAACFDTRYLSADVSNSVDGGIVRATTWYLSAHFGLATDGQPAQR